MRIERGREILARGATATLAFRHGRPAAEQKLKAGATAEQEAAVLGAWHARGRA